MSMTCLAFFGDCFSREVLEPSLCKGTKILCFLLIQHYTRRLKTRRRVSMKMFGFILGFMFGLSLNCNVCFGLHSVVRQCSEKVLTRFINVMPLFSALWQGTSRKPEILEKWVSMTGRFYIGRLLGVRNVRNHLQYEGASDFLVEDSKFTRRSDTRMKRRLIPKIKVSAFCSKVF